MSQKVVFLDDGSITARRLKRAIVACGYSFTEANSEVSLRDELAKGAQAVIHVPQHSHRFIHVVNKLIKEYPRLPVIHVVEEGNFTNHEWLKSPFHEWLDITTTVQALVRRVENLVHFASLETRLTRTEDRASRIDQFTRAIGSVDVQIVLRKTLETFGREFPSENVLWFSDECLAIEGKRFLDQRQVPVSERKPTRTTWLASEELTRDSLDAIFASWTLTHGAEWASGSHPAQMNGRDYIFPVRAMTSDGYVQKPLGHLVVVAPQQPEELGEQGVLPAYLDLLGQQLKEALEYQNLQALTYKDDLTDLYNQRYLPVVLEQELQRASQANREFSVLFCDVDFFKSVNDTKGHMVGSKVLVELSRIFKGSIRTTDFAFRYGGDEYVIVLSGTNSKQAALVAERLRTRAADATFDINGNVVKITVSIGIATYPEHAKSAEEILQMADEAMYYGKHKSRNVIHVAS
jgi:diguanylate cyclase (GGDEF)-like protein